MSALALRIGFVTCLCASPVLSQNAGVLLAAKADVAYRYRTVWIYPAGNTMNVTSIPGILVPRRSGFWRVGTDRTAVKGGSRLLDGSETNYDSSEERLWVERATARHIVKRKPGEVIVRSNVESCEDLYREISFVSPDYLAYRDNLLLNCGVHPDGEDQWNVVPLSALAGPRISILDFLGETVRKPFVDGLNGAALEQGGGKPGECEGPEEVDFGDWAIVRGKGRWVLQGYVTLPRLCGYFGQFDLPVPVPEKVAKELELPIPWQRLASEIPDLRDALASPQRDLLVALTSKEVLVYRLHGDRLGEEIVRRTRSELNMRTSGWGPGTDSGKIIMAQWAEGGEVVRWTREIKAFQSAQRQAARQPAPKAQRK